MLLYFFKTIINEEKDGFDDIKNEEDPLVLAALIWSWLDNLQVTWFKQDSIFFRQNLFMLLCFLE